jgi:signal transduction histidine kinase
MSTMFAPAARTDAAQLAADVAHFQSQPLLQEFFAAVPEMFVVLNEQREIVFANRALLDALQCDSIDDVAGQRMGEALNCAHAFDETDPRIGICGTTEFCRECGAVQATLNALVGKSDVQECRITLEDGAALDLRVTARPLQLAGRRYVLFAVADIGHEKRRRVLERIFFHDILNTAGGMLGVAELLRTGTTAEVADFKDTVALLANSLVDEIRAQQMLLAAERGELKLQPERIQSLTLLFELRNTYINHDVCIGRLVEVDPNSDLVVFVSDARLVRRVIGNMVKNALEGCRPGETATLSCRSTPEGVEFSVQNPGFMPRKVQLQVFQRSFSSKGDGRGLGTYSMKLLTEQYLQGSVSFESTPEHGTIFRAHYPLQLGEG